MVGVTVYDNDTDSQVDKSEIWSMDSILEEGVFSFRKEEIQQRVKKVLVELKTMKDMATKYAALNEKQLKL